MNPGGDFIVFLAVPWAYWDFRIVPQSALWLEPMEASGWRRCRSEMPNVKSKLMVLMAGWIAND